MEGKEKLNIAIFSWRGPGHPNAGGAEQATFEYAKGWVQAGHNVSLFTSYYIGAKREEKIAGVNIIRRGFQFLGVQVEAFKWYLFGIHLKFDIVVDEFHGIPFFTPLYIRVKKLAFIHEVTKEVWSLNPWPRPFNLVPAILGTSFEPLIFKLFYRNTPFITGSNSTKEDLINWGIPQKNISVISYGVNIPKVKIFPKEKEKTLIFLGALSKDKGIEDALEVFSILNHFDNSFRFWIAGKGEKYYLKKLKLQSSRLGISKKMKFWGYVSEEKKFELLGRAHILVNCSVREGWGLVVIEAAAMGTPTVGYNVAGLRDSILHGRTGIVCNPNPKACSEAILSLVSDQKKYQGLIQNCFEWAGQFNWKKSVEKSLLLLEKIKSA